MSAISCPTNKYILHQGVEENERSANKPKLDAMTTYQDLSIENEVVVQLVQAMLGLISSRLRAVAVRVNETEISIFFLYHEIQPSDRDDVEDICFELDVLLEGKYYIITEIEWKVPRSKWEGRNERGIFVTKGENE